MRSSPECSPQFLNLTVDAASSEINLNCVSIKMKTYPCLSLNFWKSVRKWEWTFPFSHALSEVKGRGKKSGPPALYDTYHFDLSNLGSCQTRKTGGEKEKKNWMTARPPTDTYRGKVATPKASNCIPTPRKLSSEERRCESIRILYLLPTHRPALTPSPYTVAVLRREDHTNSIRQETRCASPSLESSSQATGSDYHTSLRLT